MEYYNVKTAIDNLEIAKEITKALLEKKLVCSVQQKEITSTWWWNNELESSKEYLLEMKTKKTLYKEEVKELLEELQEYMISVDKEGYSTITKDYKEKYFEKIIKEVNAYQGKIFLAIDKKVVGLIIGLINNEDISTYDYKAPKLGRVTELIVKEEYRNNKVGKQLLQKMEEYFKEVGCKGILLNVFTNNKIAKKFYEKEGYSERTSELIKQI